MLKKQGLWRGLTFVFAMLLAVSACVAIVLESNKNEIDGFFGTHSSVLVTTDDGSLWTDHTPDKEYLTAEGKGDSQKLVDAHVALNERMSAEGSVLLKNEAGLPLAKNSKITLLGIRSHVILAGSGMGVSAKKEQVVQLEEALAKKYTVNPVMSEIYEKLNATAKLTNNDRAAAKNYNPKEPSVADIEATNSAYADSFADYHDAAIVVLGRPSSEMGDYAPGAAGVDPSTGASTAMALTDNEKDVIALATEKFSKVIVLINTNSAMEIDDLKRNDKIAAILWVGHPGCYGVNGIADILDGTVSPSGHLYDIYAADSLSAPAMMNMGDFAYANPASDFTRKPSNGSNNKYLIEAEGVYVGYRYYETRYEDCVLGKGGANSETGAYKSSDGWNYADEVSYGFGYGMSYSSFKQTLDNVKIERGPHDLKAEITVTVENTGDYDAKDVVQVYGQAPYIAGGVEKPSVQLLTFDKTEELAKKSGKTTLKLTADLQDLASWDSAAADGKGSYILDEGDYYFAIGNGAHDALNNILAAKKAGGVSVDTAKMTAAGDAAKAHKWHYDYPAGKVDDQTFAVSKAGTKVGNALPTADWNYWDPAEKVTYMSRNSWSATYPKTYADLTAPAAMVKQINGHVYDVKTDDDVSGVSYGKAGDLKFADMKGIPFDDDKWDELLDQLDIKEAMLFIYNGNRVYSDMASIGFVGGRFTENGPNGIGGRGFGSISYNNFGETTPPWYIPETDTNASFGMNIFPSAPVVASTFDPEIAYEQGKLIGNDALFTGLPILWGPGMNTHRHPYNGRSGEYYSEDPVITGIMGMEFSVGALRKGLIAAPKHFAFNDQEQNRTGVAPFMTEQRAREVELRAFQIAFEATKYGTAEEDVGMLGVMASFSKIGPTEVTASKGMLTDILRGEWGYKGYIVSDMNDDTDIYTECVLAGLSSFDAGSGATWEAFANKTGLTEDVYLKDASVLQAVREAVHYDLYVLTRSNYMNGFNTSTHSEWRMTWWRGVYVAMIVVTAVLTLAAGVVTALSARKNKQGGRK